MNSITSMNSYANSNIQPPSYIATAPNGSEIVAYNGSYTWDSNTYTKMYVFTETSGVNTLKLPADTTIGICLVGGGGGSGGHLGLHSSIPPGGAGGGGIVRGRMLLNGGASYNITIGQGGTRGLASTITTNPGDCTAPSNGGDSTIVGTNISEKAIGGGAGSYNNGNMGTVALQEGTNNGKGGGCGGGGHFSWNVGGKSGLTTQASNTPTLTYMGNNGADDKKTASTTGSGGGGASGIGTVGCDATQDTTGGVFGLGGPGYNILISGTSNPFSNTYFAAGGCGGSFDKVNFNLNQSSSVATGSVAGGTSSIPTPPQPTTYGTGASGCVGSTSLAGPTGYYGQHGQNGKQGICIILVP